MNDGNYVYMFGYALNTIGIAVGLKDASKKFIMKILPAASKAKSTTKSMFVIKY